MKCFRELDPDADVIPLYVARNRSNLQSITFDSIDVSVLLTKLERLTDQVAMLQTGLEAQTTVTQNIKELNDNAVSWIHRLETNQHNASTVKNVSMCTHVPHSKLKSFIKNFQHNITPNNGRPQCRLKGRPQYLAGVPLLIKRASHRILHLEQIESSKTILYESCQGIEGERMKKRKQPNKHLNNIRDIIDRFNEVGLVAPQFVTHNLSKLTPHVQVFQSHNDTWRRTEVIITDKDMTERSVFATLFPAASLQLCLFHVLQSIRASREAIQGKSTMSEVQCKVGYHTKENSDLIISEDSRTFIEDKKQNALRDSKVDEFFGNVRKYFITVCDYLVVKLPLQNEVLKHAEVADVRLQKLLM